MNMLRNGLTAIALVGTLIASSVVPTQAQQFSYGQRDRVIRNYCDSKPWDRDCGAYNRGGWRDSDYNRFYHRRSGDLDNIASGLFGFGFGAILGGAIANSNNNRDRLIGPVGGSGNAHVRACFSRYKSYDQGTDSYLGFDGNRHRCNL